MIYCTSVYEDEITHQVMLRIYDSFRGYVTENRAINCNGKGKIKKQIIAYNNAAQYGYFFIITDLDSGYDCAPLLIKDWLPYKCSNHLIFRVAVHEVESWLIADRQNFAAFFSISRSIIPVESDKIADPKQAVINLARKSRKREILESIIPIDDYAVAGPGYNTKFQSFIQNYWDIDSARKNSPSLDKAVISFEKAINFKCP